jgi:UDP-glucose 4-epimerase
MKDKIKYKIAIIGSNGYIARNLAFFINSKREESFDLKYYDIQDSHIDNLQPYFKIDLLNKETLGLVDFDCDYIFFFSGKTGTFNGFNEYESFIQLNEIGLLNFLDVYKSNSTKAKLIYPSTRLVYKGKKNEKINENDEKDYLSIYAINKMSAEKYIDLYSKIFNIKYSIFRICVVYGTLIERVSSYGTIGFFLKNAYENRPIIVYGDGSQKRTLIHIYDLCNNLLKGALSGNTDNDIFNIGGYDELSILEIAQQISSHFNVGIEFIEWPTPMLLTETGDTVFESSKFDYRTTSSYEISFSSWIKSIK